MKKPNAATKPFESKITLLLLAVFLCLFAFSAAELLTYFAYSTAEANAFSSMAQVVEENKAEENTGTTNQDELEPQILPEYATLYGENADLWGWLKINDTDINYPIMHTPTNGEYYLHRDFAKKYSQSGTPFLAAECNNDCGNYLIYGHNMKNGQMFAPLLSYADRDFYTKHPTILLDTLYEHGEYAIVAAFYAKAYYLEDSDVFRYYQYTDLSERNSFDDYLNQVKAAAIYETGESVEFGEQLLTLSTCSYHTDNGRFVVVAKKITPME